MAAGSSPVLPLLQVDPKRDTAGEFCYSSFFGFLVWRHLYIYEYNNVVEFIVYIKYIFERVVQKVLVLTVDCDDFLYARMTFGEGLRIHVYSVQCLCLETCFAGGEDGHGNQKHIDFCSSQ